MPGTGSEVSHRGLVTQTGPEAEHLPGGGQGFGIFGPVEMTGLEVSAVIDPQIWAGMVTEPLVRVKPVLEVLAGPVTPPWVALVTEPGVELVMMVPLLPQPQLDHRGHP